MLRILSLVALATTFTSVRAQTTVFVEGLGNGLLYSVNAERAFTPHLAARLGATYVSGTVDNSDVDLLLFPIMASTFVGRGTHRAEVGVGTYALIGTVTDESGDEFGGGVGGFTSTFGYRYGRPEGGLSLRGTLTASFIPSTGWFYLPGASVGYTFGAR